MKTLFSFFFLLPSIITVGQINSGVIDSSSIAGQIVHRLTTGNSEIQYLAEQISKIKFQGYRICDQKMFTVDSLDHLLDKEQVQTLLDSPDRT